MNKARENVSLHAENKLNKQDPALQQEIESRKAIYFDGINSRGISHNEFYAEYETIDADADPNDEDGNCWLDYAEYFHGR